MSAAEATSRLPLRLHSAAQRSNDPRRPSDSSLWWSSTGHSDFRFSFGTRQRTIVCNNEGIQAEGGEWTFIPHGVSPRRAPLLSISLFVGRAHAELIIPARPARESEGPEQGFEEEGDRHVWHVLAFTEPAVARRLRTCHALILAVQSRRSEKQAIAWRRWCPVKRLWCTWPGHFGVDTSRVGCRSIPKSAGWSWRCWRYVYVARHATQRCRRARATSERRHQPKCTGKSSIYVPSHSSNPG